VVNAPQGTARDVYVITRYEDLEWAAQHPELFSSVDKWIAPQDTYDEPLSMIQLDPPEHTRARRIGFAPFRPSRLANYLPSLRAIANELIDGFVANGRCEFIRQFARPLRLRATERIMGFSIESRDWRQGGHSDGDKGGTLLQDETILSQSESRLRQDYLQTALIERHVRPLEDGLSDMVQEQVRRDGEVDLEYLRANASTVLLAGSTTTPNALGMSMLLLLQNPGQMTLLRSDPGMIPGMIEETLRFASPVLWTPRRLTQDVELHGAGLAKGARVAMMWASANRDPTWFSEPEVFDIERPDAANHMAFGHGVHFCLGAALARLEMRLAWDQLLLRLKNIRLAPGRAAFTYLSHPSHQGLTELHIEFDPA
jgi:cytochrome P450